MGQTTASVPPSGYGQLHFSDVWKGLIKSCGGLIIGLVIKLIQDKFKLPTYDQIEPLLEAGAYFLLGYLGVNAATNNTGQLFTKDQPVVAVSAEKLDQVVEKANEVK